MLCWLALFTLFAQEPTLVIVDPSSSSRADGAPVVATLAEALAWVAERPAAPGGYEIGLVPGVHAMRRSAAVPKHPSPIRIRGLGPGTRVSGGLVITAPDWMPVSDDAVLARLPEAARTEVRALTLSASDLDAWPTGLVGPVHRGMGHSTRAIRSELFVGGQAQVSARWPNQGFAKPAAVPDSGSSPRAAQPDMPAAQRVIEPDRGGTFVLEDRERLARWAQAPEFWAFGYWWWDWADEQLPVAGVDVESGSVTLALPHRYSLRESARFYVTGLPEELDAPGEYWIDRDAGKIYAWLTEAQRSAEVAVSLLGEPMLTLAGARDVTIEDLHFVFSRGGGIEATGVQRLEIRRCTFASLGTQAVRIEGAASAVRECLFEDLGAGGVALSGGDRATLTHAGNLVEDCLFRRCSRVLRTYQPAIGLSGVGQRAAHNEIHDLPHIGIMFGGNEHLIERNRIHHVVQETGDSGAIYCGRDWTLHGTVIRENFFHDVAGSNARYQNAVYLDDMASGIVIERNLFVRCNWGMLLGGGRDLIVRGNALIACGMALHFDARGVGWMAPHIADPATSTLHKNLAAMPIASEPWRSRYPSLQRYLEHGFGKPVGSRVVGNSLFGTPLGWIEDRETVRVTGTRTTPGEPSEADTLADLLTTTRHDGRSIFAPPDWEEFLPIPYGVAGPRGAVGAPLQPWVTRSETPDPVGRCCFNR